MVERISPVRISIKVPWGEGQTAALIVLVQACWQHDSGSGPMVTVAVAIAVVVVVSVVVVVAVTIAVVIAVAEVIVTVVVRGCWIVVCCFVGVMLFWGTDGGLKYAER